jgi:predicted dehydrogenase
MKTYRAALIGCGNMAGPIEDEVRGLPGLVLPYSHADSFQGCDRTELVALVSRQAHTLEWFGKRFGIPKEHHYSDYREMIEKEQPDIVTVGTQPEERAERVIYAAEHGVKGIYAEKAMAASMQETDAMVEAVERNGVAFNLGTQRRWEPGFDAMKAMIASGELGPLRALVTHYKGTMSNVMSHYFDLLLHLADDNPVSWVQAELPGSEDAIVGDTIVKDPAGHGILQFENGVTGYVLLSGKGDASEHEAICEGGSMTQIANGADWQLRRFDREDEHHEFPHFEPASSTVKLIEDIAHSLDTGEPTRGNVRVARASTELIFAFIESHRNGGARVELPLVDSKLKFEVNRPPKPFPKA